MKNRIQNIIREKKRCLFVSPHLDDAALSAGGLIEQLAQHTEVMVVTVFTEGSSHSSLSAKQFLKQCSYDDAESLFHDRRREDTEAFKFIHVPVIHLGNKDALWRKRSNTSMLRKFIGTIIPECDLIYPTYRFHMTRGVVSPDDRNTFETIKQQLAELCKGYDEVFCPAGIGGHIDHILVRDVVQEITSPIYWIDQPYAQRSLQVDKTQNFENHKSASLNKSKLLGFYGSQIRPLFGTDKPPYIPELFTFEVPDSDYPPLIGEFVYQNEINIQGKSRNFVYALYENSSGKKAFFKKWMGNKYNHSLSESINEVLVYTLLRKYACDSQLRSEFPDISIPEIYMAGTHNSSPCILLEFISGNTIQSQPHMQKISIYEQLYRYLDTFGSLLTREDMRALSKRNTTLWILLTPLIASIAVCKYPLHLRTIMRSCAHILVHYPRMHGARESFIHRDLNDSNIIVDNGRIHVVDFQLGCLSHKTFEYVSSCYNAWLHPSFAKELITSVKRNCMHSPHDSQLFESSALFLGLYDMALPKRGDVVDPVGFLKYMLDEYSEPLDYY